MGRYAEALGHLEDRLWRLPAKSATSPWSPRCCSRWDLRRSGMATPTRASLFDGSAGTLARDLGNTREILAARNALAQFHRAEGELDAAEPHYEATLTLARELGDRESIAIGLLNLAMVSIGRGSEARVPAACCSRCWTSWTRSDRSRPDKACSKSPQDSPRAAVRMGASRASLRGRRGAGGAHGTASRSRGRRVSRAARRARRENAARVASSPPPRALAGRFAMARRLLEARAWLERID